jgi:hypothetical protein
MKNPNNPSLWPDFKGQAKRRLEHDPLSVCSRFALIVRVRLQQLIDYVSGSSDSLPQGRIRLHPA